MKITFEFHGTLRDAAGAKTVGREFDPEATVGDAVAALADEYRDLGPLLFRSNGRIRPNVTVAVDGETVPDGDREGRVLTDGETVMLAPGIAGGREVPAR